MLKVKRIVSVLDTIAFTFSHDLHNFCVCSCTFGGE